MFHLNQNAATGWRQLRGKNWREFDTRSSSQAGTRHSEILNLAAERKIDLIVMGTHGRTGVKRFLLGSVAERVVRESPVPVLTIHPKAALS